MALEEGSRRPELSDALKAWTLIGFTSFGGPAGQIALMHKVIVEDKKWLDERSFLLALNFCTLLPGPEAMQLATYTGWRLHGVKGGLAAGLLFVIPGACVILALSALYAAFGNVPIVTTIFTGIKAAVLAIVIEALLRISRRSLKDRAEWFLAACAFVAIFFFKVPFPVIIVAAGLAGFWRGINDREAQSKSTAPRIAPLETARTVALWLAIWVVPLASLAFAFGSDHVFAKLAWFFSKMAVVTFGGAYAVLAYVAQDVVGLYGWLQPGEMLDGLGLAETTPGPLILVNEFVGFLAAFRHGGGAPIVMGALGALIVLWATFAPCFLWIFAGAPYIERLASMPRLKSALNAITAAVVGVVLNLSVWFALHVLFKTVGEVSLWPLQTSVPDVSSIDVVASLLAVVAAIALFVFKRGMLAVLVTCAVLAWAASLF